MRAVALGLIAMVASLSAADDSIVAVVTHRGGFASGLAHDHLIALAPGAATLTFDANDPLAATLVLETTVEALIVDDATLRERWSPRLEALEVIDRPLARIDDDAIVKIRKAMLGRKQLDATRHERLSASIDSVLRKATSSGAIEFPYTSTVVLNAHGASARGSMAARFEIDGDRVVVEALGAFLFSELGIKPYSAMLGAVRNRDRFHVYVHLVLTSPAHEEIP